MGTSRKHTASPPAANALVFRDALYTSRVLILPDNRQLIVSSGQVTASPDDDVALVYLQEHPHFKPTE
ncbi:hypothetical protein D3C77_132850 [compost metagenome]|uniref:hypothetical protein n=1 Tax=Pseudomonas TaxID=286 RepID=UPI0004144930|nr:MULTISPECIES: hypothetical protein [Pseudomonas]MCW2267777.1 hypothetical protein [Pseudomonas sp. JUb96]